MTRVRSRRMPPAPLAPILLAAGLLLFPLLLVACDDEAEAPTGTPTPAAPADTPSPTPIPPSTPTPEPTPSPTSTATPEPAGNGAGSFDDVEAIDFSDPELIGPIIGYFGGGEIETQRVEYTDMTGDGADEAIVIVESGGTMGDVGAAIFAVRDGEPVVLDFVEAAGRVEVRPSDIELALLATLEPVFAAGDPQCCPSSLNERVYRWNEEAESLEIQTEQVIENPEG